MNIQKICFSIAATLAISLGTLASPVLANAAVSSENIRWCSVVDVRTGKSYDVFNYDECVRLESNRSVRVLWYQ
jgi:hypothetical protein